MNYDTGCSEGCPLNAPGALASNNGDLLRPLEEDGSLPESNRGYVAAAVATLLALLAWSAIAYHGA